MRAALVSPTHCTSENAVTEESGAPSPFAQTKQVLQRQKDY